MPVKCDPNSIVTKYRMALGNHRAAMARYRAEHRIALTGHSDTAELHGAGPSENGAATGCFVVLANDALHVLFLFKKQT